MSGLDESGQPVASVRTGRLGKPGQVSAYGREIAHFLVGAKFSKNSMKEFIKNHVRKHLPPPPEKKEQGQRDGRVA